MVPARRCPGPGPFYVSKHDGIQNFTASLNNADWTRQVPITYLAGDLASGDVPRFSYIVPDECHDMHGDPPYCLDSGNIGDPENQHLVAAGDGYLGQLVSEITHASFWAEGNNAIAITYDIGDNSAGCCDANPGGGQIATIVIISHGPRGVQDSSPANHWTVVPTPDPGSSGNHLYAVGAVGPDDVWAAGQQLGGQVPDQGLVEHWDGHSWSVVDLPVSADASVMLTGIAAIPGDQVWVAGEADSPLGGGRPLIESYASGTWSTASLPASAGSIWTNLWGITVAGGTVWAVGTYLDPQTDNSNTLILAGNGVWTVHAGPDPGSGSNILGGVTAIGGHPWAAGSTTTAAARCPSSSTGDPGPAR